MSEILSKIKAPIAREMSLFDELFTTTLSGNDGLLNEVLEHITQRGGKRMRPILTILIAKSLYHNMHGGLYRDFVKLKELLTDDNASISKTLHAACSLELLHTASLIHDDVVDESDQRRGQQSVNASYNNKVAVLVGDYVLSTSLKEIALTNEPKMTAAVAKLGQTLSEGEVKQLQAIATSEFSIDTYYDVISKKTASLFETCCYLGALSVNAADEDIAKACEFGHNIGIIFQIRDDIFDYSDAKQIGKPTGNDMKEGKLTLPVLFVLTDSDSPCPEEITTIAKKVKSLIATQDEINQLIEYTKTHGGLNHARHEMESYYNKAKEYIDNEVHNKKYKDALQMFLDYVIGRDF